MIDRYTRPAMGALWTLEARYAAWLEVELAVCETWSALGLIPAEDLATIKAKARIDALTTARILELEETTKHDVIAFLAALEEQVGPAARFIHLGCTSSDIVDTANALLLTRAGHMLLAGVDNLLAVLKDLALAHKGQLMMGRTHGIHAEPTSFALKMAGHYAEFVRHRQRLAAAVADLTVGKLSGAVGTYTALTPEVEAGTMARLGLAVDPVSTQIIQRDRYAAFFTTLGVVAGGMERLCVELRHLQRTEVREVEEGFSKGQKGSSAMPHKKNPISAENLTGMARLIRSFALAAMEDQALWHERDISHSSVERVIMPDATIALDYALARLAGVLKNLRVLPQNMARNMDASLGLFYSQKVLTALIDAGMARQQAYELVQAVAMRCWESGTLFPEAVRAEPAVGEKLSAQSLDSLFDPRSYLRFEDAILARAFAQPA